MFCIIFNVILCNSPILIIVQEKKKIQQVNILSKLMKKIKKPVYFILQYTMSFLIKKH